MYRNDPKPKRGYIFRRIAKPASRKDEIIFRLMAIKASAHMKNTNKSTLPRSMASIVGGEKAARASNMPVKGETCEGNKIRPRKKQPMKKPASSGVKL